MAQELDFLEPEITFTKFGVQLVLLQALKHNAEMLYMLLFILGISSYDSRTKRGHIIGPRHVNFHLALGIKRTSSSGVIERCNVRCVPHQWAGGRGNVLTWRAGGVTRQGRVDAAGPGATPRVRRRARGRGRGRLGTCC